MYYPEANVLVPRRIDPLSKTPAFKSVLISLEEHAPEGRSRPEPHRSTQCGFSHDCAAGDIIYTYREHSRAPQGEFFDTPPAGSEG